MQPQEQPLTIGTVVDLRHFHSSIAPEMIHPMVARCPLVYQGALEVRAGLKNGSSWQSCTARCAHYNNRICNVLTAKNREITRCPIQDRKGYVYTEEGSARHSIAVRVERQ